jgi:cytidine deaminase
LKQDGLSIIFTPYFILMTEHSLHIAYTEYHSVEELEEKDRFLLTLAREACKSAYAPYSKFYVGAALRLENGTIVKGNNQENSAYPSGLCAERVAIFAASSQNPGIAIESLAIAVSTTIPGMQSPVTPCGGCRQVISEYENLSGKAIKVWMLGNNGMVWLVNGVSNLLPLMFQGEQLKK